MWSLLPLLPRSTGWAQPHRLEAPLSPGLPRRAAVRARLGRIRCGGEGRQGALFKPGDEVFGTAPYPDGVGSHAEYVTAPARAFAHKPSQLSHVEAGALPLAALTAWQALVGTAQLQADQRVLVHTAAGGVGHLAVQIARSRGAHVIATASSGKYELLRSLGADELETDFTKAVGNVDVALDPSAAPTAPVPCIRSAREASSSR